MRHPFEALRPEYSQLLALMRVSPDKELRVDATAKRLLGFLDNYRPVAQAIGVPEIFIATSFEREASSNFKLNPAQGWPLTSRSQWIPHNGPFQTWFAAALAAYRLNGLDKVGAGNWTWELVCFYGEMFNGFGYRDFHHMHTPYLWAWSTIQTTGKYTSDGKFDPDHYDEQMGMIPVARRMAELMPALALPVSLPPISSPSLVPEPQHSSLAADGAANGPVWLQAALNRLGFQPPLAEDGSYGRQTAQAVRSFQRDYGITVDGLAGPETISALQRALEAVAAGG